MLLVYLKEPCEINYYFVSEFKKINSMHIEQGYSVYTEKNGILL